MYFLGSCPVSNSIALRDSVLQESDTRGLHHLLKLQLELAALDDCLACTKPMEPSGPGPDMAKLSQFVLFKNHFCPLHMKNIINCTRSPPAHPPPPSSILPTPAPFEPIPLTPASSPSRLPTPTFFLFILVFIPVTSLRRTAMSARAESVRIRGLRRGGEGYRDCAWWGGVEGGGEDMGGMGVGV